MIHTIDLKHQKLDNVIASFLVETSEGPVLIESGPYSAYPQLKTGVEKLGYHIDDIHHVLLTHIHFDHAGAAWALAEKGANIYVHPIGYPHMIDPSKLVNSATRIYGDQMETLWGALNPISPSNLVTCDHKETISIGDQSFVSWHTPGHANHHIAWQWNNNLFTGDVAGVKIQSGIIVPPCPPPDINLEKWQESINLIRSLPLAHLYLTHYGRIDDIPGHLDGLEKILYNWAQWMKPYAEEACDVKDITPLFQNYVAGQLKDFGISETGILQYESANPSWMSVAGLMRYWNKKFQDS